MAKRKAITKKVRFEVFKRDRFTCQYCGKKAPDVVLNADHIHPVAKGGTNEIANLITSCAGCNSGKSDRLLSDDAVAQKSHKQNADLQERRDQIKMMAKWQKGLQDVTKEGIEAASDVWRSASGWEVSGDEKTKIKSLIKRFGFAEVLEAMRIAADRYLQEDYHGVTTRESCIFSFHKIGGICYVRAQKNPEHTRMLCAARAALKGKVERDDNAFNDAKGTLRKSGWVQCGIVPATIKQTIAAAYKSGTAPEAILQAAKNYNNFAKFCEDIRHG